MADYRLSAQVIKRSSGRSATAAAAYRAAMRLVDERTGLIHDYTRKAGVVHAEILAPKQTPEWMLDRAELWNAVEKVERRKDAQLSREIQLSLPHELKPEQRLELVRDYVQGQFVDRGMIADICIHEPDGQSDERNHHAHIMLTMRELSADGFGKKNREWNSREIVNEWREEWANLQNRSLERHGHNERVDHRSYEAQGIDKQPTQHMGNKATEMERRGEVSRIGEKNRTIEFANAAQVRRTAYRDLLAAQIERTKTRTAAPEKLSFKDRLRLQGQDIDSRHDNQRKQLSERQEKQNTKTRNSINAQLRAVSFKLENATGARKLLRGLLGHTKADRATQNQLQKALQAIKVKEQIERVELERKQHLERDNFGGQSPELRQQFSRTTVSSASEQTREEEPNFKDRLRESYRRSTEGKKENKRDREQENGIERKPNEP